MQSMCLKNDLYEQSFITINSDIVTEASQHFADMTGYKTHELLNKNIEEILSILRVGPDFDIEHIDEKADYFLFTKSLDVRFVSIEVRDNMNEKVCIISEKPDSRLEDKLIFVQQTIEDNIIGAAVFSVPDLILIKANQKYLDFMDYPYNLKQNSIGKPIREIVTGFEGTQAEVIWKTVLETQKTSYVKENRHDKFSRGVTYWDSTQTPVFENGKMKYIFETAEEVTERVLNRRRIQEQNELLKRQASLLDLSSEAIFAWELNGGIIYWNKAAEQMYGYSSEEAVGCISYKLLKTVFPEGIEDYKSILLRDGVWKGEIEHSTKDGKKLIVETNHQIILNDLGQYTVLETSRDVTERRKIEKEFREQKEMLEATIENMSDAVVVSDKDGKILKINAEAKRIFYQLESTSYLGETFKTTRYLDTEGNDIQYENMPAFRALRGEKVRNARIIVKRPDKELIIETNVTPVYDIDGNIIMTVSSTRDVTEQVHKDEIIRMQGQQLEGIVMNMSDVLLVYDKDGNIQFLNDMGKKVFYNPGSYKKLGDSTDTTRYLDASGKEIPIEGFPVSRSLKGEKVTNFIMTPERPDGRIHYNVSSGPVYDRHGNISYVIACMSDITELVNKTKIIEKQNTELQQAKELADSANRAKSQFLANMSHEIRTPMQGILGMTDLLKYTDLNDEQSELVISIEECSESLLNIINDILDLSKIDAGKVELNPVTVDTISLINENISLFSMTAVKKGLGLEVNIGEDIPEEIMVDKTRLTQVLRNLIGNAVKFTQKGKIVFSVNKINDVGNKVKLMFSISDTGIGIKGDDIPKLFNYFTQLDNSTTKRFQGTGLGLAISKRLVELMDGEIFVESKIGIGSTFYFTILADIPMKKQDVYDLQDAVLSLESRSKSNILLVEDNSVSQLIIKKKCQQSGWNLQVATNGKEALNILESDDFDVILMDIQMPEMSGFDVTKIIREREKVTGKRTPIIATTAYAMSGDKEKCLDMGMDDYFSKPIDIKKLCEAIERLSGRRIT